MEFRFETRPYQPRRREHEGVLARWKDIERGTCLLVAIEKPEKFMTAQVWITGQAT